MRKILNNFAKLLRNNEKAGAELNIFSASKCVCFGIDLCYNKYQIAAHEKSVLAAFITIEARGE